jgi:hypothetical protein
VKESKGITLEAGLSWNKEPCTARTIPGGRPGSGESLRAAGRSLAASAPSV